MEDKGSMVKHALGEVTHDRLGLDMKIAEHFVRAPAADETDDIGVDLGAKESHSACSSEAAGRNISRKET